MAIRKRGNRYCVLTADLSRTIGCHGTRRGAENQLQAIESAMANSRRRRRRRRSR